MTLQIILSDGTTTIELPPDLHWRDEFGWTPVEQDTEYSLTGALIVQSGARQAGRPITLYGGDGAWIKRSVLEQLYAMAAIPGQTMTLNLWGRTFTVMFRDNPIEAEMIRRVADPGPDAYYAITINMMEVSE